MGEVEQAAVMEVGREVHIVKPGQAQGDRLGLAPLLTSSGPER